MVTADREKEAILMESRRQAASRVMSTLESESDILHEEVSYDVSFLGIFG
jgi:hypothetical protein